MANKSLKRLCAETVWSSGLDWHDELLPQDLQDYLKPPVFAMRTSGAKSVHLLHLGELANSQPGQLTVAPSDDPYAGMLRVSIKIRSMCRLPDARHLVCVSRDWQVEVWDVYTLRQTNKCHWPRTYASEEEEQFYDNLLCNLDPSIIVGVSPHHVAVLMLHPRQQPRDADGVPLATVFNIAGKTMRACKQLYACPGSLVAARRSPKVLTDRLRTLYNGSLLAFSGVGGVVLLPVPQSLHQLDEPGRVDSLPPIRYKLRAADEAIDGRGLLVGIDVLAWPELAVALRVAKLGSVHTLLGVLNSTSGQCLVTKLAGFHATGLACLDASRVLLPGLSSSDEMVMFDVISGQRLRSFAFSGQLQVSIPARQRDLVRLSDTLVAGVICDGALSWEMRELLQQYPEGSQQWRDACSRLAVRPGIAIYFVADLPATMLPACGAETPSVKVVRGPLSSHSSVFLSRERML